MKHANRIILVAASLYIILWSVSYLADALEASLNFNGFPADGPFQLFNPMRRLAAGQHAGIDFQFFHGIGLPFLHFPLFYLFGQTIFASELSRHLISLGGYLGVAVAFGYVATRGKLAQTACFVALALAMLEHIFTRQLTFGGNILAMPGNSLMGERSTVPLMALIMWRVNLPDFAKAVLVGVGCVLALCLGTEQGEALIASVFLVGAVIVGKSLLSGSGLAPAFSLGKNVRTCLALLGGLVACGAVIFGLGFGVDRSLAILKYNLAEAPGDQFWYFGCPPNAFAERFMDLVRVLNKALGLMVVAAVLLLGGLYRMLRGKSVSPFSLTGTVAMLSLYGLITCVSCLGILNAMYLMPLARVVVFTSLLIFFDERCLQLVAAKFASLSLGGRRVLIGCALLLVGGEYWLAGRPTYSNITVPAGTFNWGHPHLGKLPKERLARLTEAIDSRPRAAGVKPVIWSTYAGILEDHYGVFNPGTDYIIHPLGAARRAGYLAAFDESKPQFVQNVRRSLFTTVTSNDYEQWIRNTSWPFYESIIANYNILTTTDCSLLWERKAAPWVTPDEAGYQVLAVVPGAAEVELPATEEARMLYSVKVKYHVKNPWAWLPVLGKLPRYMIVPDNTGRTLPVSVPPSALEWRFPVYTKAGVKPRLKFEVHSLLPQNELIVDEVAWKPVPIEAANAMIFDD